MLQVKSELDHMATFLKMAVAYKKKIGFGAQFTIEPKAREPTAHQYDYDAQTVIGFLYQLGASAGRVWNSGIPLFVDSTEDCILC